MNNFALKQENAEYVFLSIIILLITAIAIIYKDYYIAVISAICGILYTFFAGKGKPFCYLIGLTGSAFYSLLALKNGIYGHLCLYLLYYIPMQITGFFQWNKNLKTDKKEIIKKKLSKSSKIKILLITIILTILLFVILVLLKASHPCLDSITTVLSVIGMYLTVKRMYEQWIVWAIVNILSLVMWCYVAQHGVKVYSTIIMWATYIILAFYFLFVWKKELCVNNFD